jgi:beta-galactosidase
VLIAMGNNEGQNETRKSELSQAGLIKTLRLLSRPARTRVDDVFVRTSTRKNEVALDITLAGLPANAREPILLQAQMLATDGRVERTFNGSIPAAAQGTITWSWPDARRWDLGKGDLYTLRLQIKGEGWMDDYKQTFGFREFWIEGRNFMLNGAPIRLRPALAGSSADWDKWQKLGANFFEIWPGGTESRGREFEPWTANFSEADRQGVLLNGVAPDMGWMGTQIEHPDQLEKYREAAERILRRDRNHPSIIMWGTSGNMLGSDFDPPVFGQREEHKAQVINRNNSMRTHYERADRGLTILRSFDSTRPIFIHNGGTAGDVYAPNIYLNFIPLQERTEWLSEYVKKGDMPAMIVEFGTPLYASYMRGRNNYGNASVTEPMMSEYSATYLGDQAFVSEPVAYRQAIASNFKGNQTYDGWHWDKTGKFSLAFQELQALFLRDTWRSWRTWGITGGMIPWDNGYTLDDGKLTPAGEAFKTANADLLAWICGPAEAFTDRTHLYRAGATVEKQIALLNDRRESLPYEVTWALKVGDRTIDQGKATGEAKPASTQFIPVSVVLPKENSDNSAVLTASVSVGGKVLEDSFALSIFAPAPKGLSAAQKQTKLLLFDPVGKTTVLLRSLGWETTAWDNQPAPGKLVVVGREALGLDGALPPALEAHVRAGGRALISVQHPDALRRLGFRVSYQQSRRAFPVNSADPHPVLAGLKTDNLRDWSGITTLNDPYPSLPFFDGHGSPKYGWRWGNRHVVSSGAIEVPHRTGWRPILVDEFGLACSPLMELDLGAGRLIWSQLDLEDQAPVDPAADRLARNLFDYAATAPLNPTLPTSAVGGGTDLIASVGIQATPTNSLPSGGLVIVGPKWTNDDALRDFLSRGGKALILPRTTGLLGVQIAPRALSTAPAPAAWPETRGLGIADLRTRSERTVPVVTDGAEIAADGLLARVKIGEGVAVFCQTDPAALTADQTTYERRTRWRWTRTIAQIAANLGASLEQNSAIFTTALPLDSDSDTIAPRPAYHPDWRSDFDLGDEPCRFYNW